VLLAGVLDAAVVQVAVELRLVDRVHRAQAHRHRRELPEVRHQPRVRIGGQCPDPVDDVRLLLAEAVEVAPRRARPSRKARAYMPGGGVALEEDVVAAAGVVLAAEEVVHPDLVERGRRGIGRDVAADADAGPLRPVHHDGGVPADPAPVSGAPCPRRRGTRARAPADRVDVVGRRQRGHPDLLAAGRSSRRSMR
jgi:hypothetical protein